MKDQAPDAFSTLSLLRPIVLFRCLNPFLDPALLFYTLDQMHVIRMHINSPCDIDVMMAQLGCNIGDGIILVDHQGGCGMSEHMGTYPVPRSCIAP